jgi:hypothetical protein
LLGLVRNRRTGKTVAWCQACRSLIAQVREIQEFEESTYLKREPSE